MGVTDFKVLEPERGHRRPASLPLFTTDQKSREVRRADPGRERLGCRT